MSGERPFDYSAFLQRRQQKRLQSYISRRRAEPTPASLWEQAALDLREMYAQAEEAVADYRALLIASPRAALDKLTPTLEEVRDISPNRAFVEAVAAGPNPDWTGAILDVLGDGYTKFDRPTQIHALTQVLRFLDHLRWDISTINVARIDNAHLATDIGISRTIYLPEWQTYTKAVSTCTRWEEVAPVLDHCPSTFWLTYALTFTAIGSDHIRDGLAETYPRLLDQTLDGVASITAAGVRWREKREGVPPEQSLNNILAKHSARYHETIQQKLGDRRWIQLDRDYQELI